MKLHNVFSMLVVACLVPSIASAQEKKVTCADNTIVTSDAACANRGGVQKPGGLNRVGKQLNKAALDVKDEAGRTPKNVVEGRKDYRPQRQRSGRRRRQRTKKTAKRGQTWRWQGRGRREQGGAEGGAPAHVQSELQRRYDMDGAVEGERVQGPRRGL